MECPDDPDDYVVIPESVDDNANVITSKTLQKIRDWLEPTDSDSPASEYRKHLHSHVKGTGEWILETDQYRQWSESDSVGNLWIRGIPGCGKSVVAADLISRLRRQGDRVVLFFFFREIIQTNKSPRSLVQDFCHDLLDHSPTLASDLLALKANNATVEAVPFDKLWKCLTSALASTPRKIYCVADALDEMDKGNDHFLEEFLDLGRQYPQSINIIVTSRQVPHLEKHMSGSCLVDLRLDRRNVDRDISIYLSQCLKDSRLDITTEKAEEVKKAICDRGKGLFLYARLMFDQLLLRPDEILSSIDNLPDGLGDMYTEILREHAVRSGTTPAFQRLVLEWITHSARPMRLLELAVMINSLPDRGGLTPESDTKLAIKTACGPLLEVCEDGVVQIIHHSLTEFALNRDVSHTKMAKTKREFTGIDSQAAHARIARTCLDYLSGEVLQGCDLDERSLVSSYTAHKQRLFLKFYFLQYAITEWPFHAARASEHDGEFHNILIKFFEKGNRPYEAWKHMSCPLEFIYYRNKKATELPPLLLSAYFNLIPLAKHFLSNGADINVTSNYHGPPLVYAVKRGHFRMVELLLKHQARHDLEDRDLMLPVHHASKYNQVQCLQLLVAHGADLTKKGGLPKSSYNPPPQTPLEIACTQGHQEAAHFLIHNMNEVDLCNSLHVTASKGDYEILTAMLAKNRVKLAVNSRSRDGETPLHVAARARSHEIVKILLDHGGDVHARAPYRPTDSALPDFRGPVLSSSYTPIHTWAVGAWFHNFENMRQEDMLGALDLLLEAGCDINARDHLGRTALFSWGQNSRKQTGDREDEVSIEFITSLLQRGANATLLDHKGASPLHMVDEPVTPKILKLFVDAGLDVNSARKKDGATPLMIAASLNRIDPSAFHELKADFDQQDWKGDTALHYWLRDGNIDRHDSWISFSSLHIQNSSGATPLHALITLRERTYAWKLCDKVSMKLIQSGSPIEIRDRAGRTPLLLALAERHFGEVPLEFIEELLNRGADSKIRDFEGRSALHYAFMIGSHSWRFSQQRVKAIELLMQAGVDIHAIDYAGCSIFNTIIRCDKEWDTIKSRAERLIEFGGPVDVLDFRGRTALHIAAAIKDPGEQRLYDRKCQEDILTRLEYLLQPPFSFDVNARDHDGVTPLHVASATSEANTWTLIQAGAHINIKDLRLRSPLHHAAESGQSNIVGLLTELLEKRSISVDQLDLNGRSALHSACRSGNSESVRLLIEAGADVTVQDECGRTPLHAAAEFKYLPQDDKASPMDFGSEYTGENTYIRRVVQLLLAAGADANIVDSKGHRPSDVATMLGCSAVLDELKYAVPSLDLKPFDSLRESTATMSDEQLQCLVDKIKVPDDFVNFFQRVVATGNERLAEKIVRAKNLRLFDDDGKSALHYAATHGLTAMMECLLPFVEDIAATLPSLLAHAAKRSLCNIEMVELLSKRIPEIEEKVSLTPSLAKLASGKHWWHPRGLLILLKAGVPTELGDGKDMPPLHAALTSMHLDYRRDQTLEILLKHGANPNAAWRDRWGSRSQCGDRPLNFAITSFRDVKILQMLIDYGASVSYGPVSAVYAAVSRKHEAALDMLLKAGADPNATDGNCPLIQAADRRISGDLALPLLLSHGANPLEPLKDGTSTALQEICVQNKWVQPIIASGCELNVRDANGHTPLMRACMYKSEYDTESQAGTLLEGGADPRLVDHDGSTALHHAILHYNLDAVRQLLKHSAPVSIVNSKGYTPLQYALECYADFLEERGADFTHILDLSNTFHQIINKLLDAGANALDILPDGRTALHCIASRVMDFSNRDREEQIRIDNGRDNFADACALYNLFLNAGCDRGTRDKNGETAIFHFVAASKSYHGSIHSYAEDRFSAREDIEWMAEQYDIHTVNNDGDTLLHTIARRENQCENEEPEEYDCELFEIFVELGLNPWQENAHGQTPLDIAATWEKPSILALFARDD